MFAENEILRKLDVGKKTYCQYKPESTLHELIKKVLTEFEFLDTANARIEPVIVYPNVSKITVARIIRTSRPLQFFSDRDYIIEISGELWDTLNEEVRKIVILHELCHIYIKEDKEGNPQYRLQDHQVKEFIPIIKQFGIDWFTKLQDSLVAINITAEMDEDKKNEIKEKIKKSIKF